MPRSVMRCLWVLIVASLPVAAAAESANGEADVDTAFALSRIRDVSLNGDDGSVLVTMRQRVMRFSTFPLHVTANADLGGNQTIPGTNIRLDELGIDAITAVSASDDKILILGEAFRFVKAKASGGDSVSNESETKSVELRNTELRGGLILGISGAETLAENPAPPSIASLASTPFNQAFFSASGRFFAVSPTWYSVISIARETLLGHMFGDLQAFETDDIFLRCGSPNEFSVLNYEGSEYYLATMADEPVIEIGEIQLNNPNAKSSVCFSPTSTRALKSRTRNTLTHRLITPEEGDRLGSGLDTSLLVFDAAQSMLIHYPIVDIKGRLIVLTSESESYVLLPKLKDKSLGETNIGIMAADESGQIVLVAYLGTDTVHRLSYARGGIEYQGSWQFSTPVRGIKVARDGSMVAIWTGEATYNGRDSLTLVRNPAGIEPFRSLPTERFTVGEVQTGLNAVGIHVGIDGILGEKTQAALMSYRDALEKAGTDSTANPYSDPTLQQNLEGLFPLGQMEMRR